MGGALNVWHPPPPSQGPLNPRNSLPAQQQQRLASGQHRWGRGARGVWWPAGAGRRGCHGHGCGHVCGCRAGLNVAVGGSGPKQSGCHQNRLLRRMTWCAQLRFAPRASQSGWRGAASAVCASAPTGGVGSGRRQQQGHHQDQIQWHLEWCFQGRQRRCAINRSGRSALSRDHQVALGTIGEADPGPLASDAGFQRLQTEIKSSFGCASASSGPSRARAQSESGTLVAFYGGATRCTEVRCRANYR